MPMSNLLVARKLMSLAEELISSADPYLNQEEDVQEAIFAYLESRYGGAYTVDDVQWKEKRIDTVSLQELDEITHAPDRQWDYGELKGLDKEDLFKELSGFRGSSWAQRALHWIAEGFPAVVVVKDHPDYPGTLWDGFGRFTVAWGLGLETLPVIEVLITTDLPEP